MKKNKKQIPEIRNSKFKNNKYEIFKTNQYFGGI